VKELCFIVNVDWFFHSHRRPLERKLAQTFKTNIIAGYSGIRTDYFISYFEVNSRVPTLRGIFQFYKEVQKLDRNTILVIVSPVMIILSHFLLRKRQNIFYNFSGLGFLRSKSSVSRDLIMYMIKRYPVSGMRVFVVQNSDDYNYFNQIFKANKKFSIEIIEGSGYEVVVEALPKINFGKLTLGYVGRLRKDKGILDLARAVSQLENEGFNINLKIWGSLDDSSRHGFSEFELAELDKYSRYLQGYSKDKQKIFSSFNWFCLPSNGEGLSKAAIEASSFGLPLILSNVQGNRDMINGNGFLFEYGEVEDLKSVLIKITKMSENEIEDMSKTSKNLFEANWTLESVYNQWKQILIKYDTLSS
jgi:glycosyltransferase involved in cell wall biosynthesis